MKALVGLIAIFLVSASASRELKDDRATAQVGIANHTPKFIYSATIDGASGGSMSAWGAGVANVCCTSIPRMWYPGMKVLVRWNMPDGVKDVFREKVVEVEKYFEPGSIYLHFFPDDEVRVIVSDIAAFSRMHPIPPPTKPTVKSGEN